MSPRLRRALVLLVGVMVSAPQVFAHPLPGSRLTISRAATSVGMMLSVPVPELILAQPNLSALGDLSYGSDVPAALQAQLRGYFLQHFRLVVAEQNQLKLRVARMRVEYARHDDVGDYAVLVLNIDAPLPVEQSLFPATLTYDAVMHEVRNHRATVWFTESHRKPVLIGKIRFDATLGRSTTLVLKENELQK